MLIKPPAASAGLSYASAGVSLTDKDSFTESIPALVRKTYGPRVIPNDGGFAGLFRLDYNQRLFARNYKDPVLVACADGVGTKVKLAQQMSVFDTVGIDLVAMNVNDLIVQGAEPLFFLDYIAVPKVDKAMLTDLIKGVVEGCKQSGCALLGGETAEMPDVYRVGDFDLAGFCVGVVELKRAIKPERVRPGDVVLGLASSGIHSNGYSLVRKVVEHAKLDLNAPFLGRSDLRADASLDSSPADHSAVSAMKKKAKKSARKADLPLTLGQVLLTPTRIYAGSIVKLQRTYKVKNVITGMAHITGSGLRENLARSIPKECDAVIERGSWDVPPVFEFLQWHGRIAADEMERVFNLGIGYCVIVKPAFADSVAENLEKLGETVFQIGKVVKGKGVVRYAE